MPESLQNDPAMDPAKMGGNIAMESSFPTLGQFEIGQVEGGVGADIVITPELAKKYERISSGEFTIDATSEAAEICIDERHRLDGEERNAARSAGGSVGIAHAYDLAAGQRNLNEDEVMVVSGVIGVLEHAGSNACPHGDDSSDCGCGQTKRAQALYETLATGIDNISAASEALGFSVSDDIKNSLKDKATSRLQQPNFFAEDRSSVTDAGLMKAQEKEILTGAHEARAIVWVNQPGKTLDVKQISEELGIDVFVVSAWSFESTSRMLTERLQGTDFNTLVAGHSLVNIATASVLCNRVMPVIPI